ncbi:MAG: hypothetical protein Q4F38_00420 [Akkermansia sp.]|nr:hypothetical protein [Akkermansia sp.]
MPIADLQTALELVSQNWGAFLADAGMVIVSLVLIEGLLSVDNALGIAAMASHLPKHQQKSALRWGLIGAYLFRGIALALVSWLMHNEWVKWFGAIYLIYLACDHLQLKREMHTEDIASAAAKTAGKGFIATICSIELMDLSLSLDNVVAAVGVVAGSKGIPEELHIWVVCLGVFIGIAALRIVAGWCIDIIARHPILGHVAFVLVGFVGFVMTASLVLESAWGIEWHMSVGPKFAIIVAIVALSICYEKYAGLHTAMYPLVRVFRVLCTAFACTVHGILTPWKLFKKKA